MDACREEQFVHIDVAEPAQERLIEKQWLDLAAMFSQALIEFLKFNVERIGPHPGKSCRKVLEEFNAAKLAHVVVDENAIFKFDDGVSVFSRCGVPQKPAGHAEMYEQIAVIEIEKDLLAAASDRKNGSARQRFRCLDGITARDEP